MIGSSYIPTVDTGPFNFGKRSSKNAKPRKAYTDWRLWLTDLFSDYVRYPFAQRHVDLWAWVEGLETGKRPRPFVAIWPRGGAKSTTAELACVRVGFRQTRRYIWYISSTQDKADKHVETIGALLEGSQLERVYPELSSRKVGKYGNSKGWRRSRLRTASGLTIDALGLDVGSRGAKVEDARPDLMIFDDVDEAHDTAATIKKKIDTITTSLLPAGSGDLAVLFIQNLIHPNSIAAKLADKTPEFLTDRILSGPFPAVEGLAYETHFDEAENCNRYTITAGEATWEGQGIEVCEQQMKTWGPTAFLKEAQHEVEQSGGIWDNIVFRHIAPADVPDLETIVVWIDPAVTATDDSDNNGVIVDGVANGILYRLYAWEGIDTPENVISRGIRMALHYGAGKIGVETNQGGDTWEVVFQHVIDKKIADLLPDLAQADEKKIAQINEAIAKMRYLEFDQSKAGTGSGGKVERNARMLVSYEQGKVIHVEGTHDVLERALRRFPIKPLDLADAAYWGWDDLCGDSWFMAGRG